MTVTRSARVRLSVIIVAVATFSSLIWASWSPLTGSIRDTLRFQPLGYHERRVRQLGPFYSSLTRLKTQVAPDEPLALITAGSNIDAALFANYYLYPHPLRIYAGRAAYRRAAGDPSRPHIVVEAGDLVERTTYGDLRDREVRKQPRLAANLSVSEPRRLFVVPIAASIDGPDPDTYVIEGTLQNPGETSAIADIRFFPSGRSTQVTIPARSSANWYDLIFQQFGVMEIGWLEVRSTQPLSGAFAFVNRGRSDVVPLPFDMHPGSPSDAWPSGRDTKLWLLNPRDREAIVTVGRDVVALKAHDLVSRPQQGALPVIKGDAIFAFVSLRDPQGATRFFWPR